MSTEQFVDKIKEAQKNDQENKEHQGKGKPAKRLPSHQGL